MTYIVIILGILLLLSVLISIVAFHERDVKEKARLQEWNNYREAVLNESPRKRFLRSEEEIDKVLERAIDGLNEGTCLWGLPYEAGVCAFAAWLFGATEIDPFGGY